MFMFERFCSISNDEPMAMYGLLAEDILVTADLSSISFRIHPKAHFANGGSLLPKSLLIAIDG